MICPLYQAALLSSPVNTSWNKKTKESYAPCDGADCAWWNEHFGGCCIAVDAYLKGQEDHRAERDK